MIYLLTFAHGEIYLNSQKNMIETKDICGVDHQIEWNLEKLQTTDFYKNNKNLLDTKIGCGLYIWKPYLILDLLDKITEDDIIFYTYSSRYETDGFKNSCK